MKYCEITKNQLKSLRKTDLGGSEGAIYFSSMNALKLFHARLSALQIQDKKRMMEHLIGLQELESFSAVPQELVFFKRRIGYWMNLIVGVSFDEWLRQNRHDLRKVIVMYRKISERLKLLHEKYGMIVSDCFYSNILIVEDSDPVFVDVDSWAMMNTSGVSNSRILFDYSRSMFWTRLDQFTYLSRSQNTDNAALWLMYFESMLNIKIRFWRFYNVSGHLERNPELLDIYHQISRPKLESVPYFHEVVKQYTLHV